MSQSNIYLADNSFAHIATFISQIISISIVSKQSQGNLNEIGLYNTISSREFAIAVFQSV